MIEVVPGRVRHVAMILPHLRREEREEMAAFGMTEPRRIVPQAVHASVYCRAAFIDGEIAALGGLVAGLMATRAQAWLLTTAAVERHPLAFARLMRREIARALGDYRSLLAHGLCDSPRTMRFWRLLGAEIGPDYKIGRDGTRVCEIRFGSV